MDCSSVRLWADDFLFNHKEELDYLILCPLCVTFHPKAGHNRKIFKSFLKCETQLQEEILSRFGMKLLPKIDETFLKASLDIYRIHQAELELGVAYPDRNNNYTPMFRRGFRLYRYQKIPMRIRKYTIEKDFATIPNQSIMNYIEDYTHRLRLINKTNENYFWPPFDIVNNNVKFFWKRENVFYSWGMYLVLLGTNMVIKEQENVESTVVDNFLEKNLIINIEDLYYLTLHALMLMMNNEKKTEKGVSNYD